MTEVHRNGDATVRVISCTATVQHAFHRQIITQIAVIGVKGVGMRG